MPTIDQNHKCWSSQHDWAQQGHDWSEPFGGTEAMWSFLLHPRIQRFLPAGHVLEIAPGYGRWTPYLLQNCQTLTGIDLTERCVEHCRRTFAAEDRAQFFTNDGRSLAAIADDSVDFAFSFDSLVHADREVIRAYVQELGRKLKPGGVGFMHHSNLGSYPVRDLLLRMYTRTPEKIRQLLPSRASLGKLLSINPDGWRASRMTAKLFVRYCSEAGLQCITQERVNWLHGRCLIDCISVFTRPPSPWSQGLVSLANGDFARSGSLVRRLACLYT